MKKTLITYLFFILAMSLFITLRVYAGKVYADENKKPATEPVAADLEIDTPATTITPTPAVSQEDPVSPVRDDNEALWHGTIKPVAEFEGLIPRIVCWGDSLTVSLDGKSAYPDILRNLSGCEVVNRNERSLIILKGS